MPRKKAESRSAELEEFRQLVREGRLFEVQDWIRAGKPFIPPKPYIYSPFRSAVETGFHSMVEVLLREGYANEHEHLSSIFGSLLFRNKTRLIPLLVQYGVAPASGGIENAFATSDFKTMSIFLDAGVDCTQGDPFALALRNPTKQHLKLYKAYKDKVPDLRRQLNQGLKFHAKEGDVKWVSMLIWAGADPHARVPDINDRMGPPYTSAIEDALMAGGEAVVDKIGFKGARADMAACLEAACFGGKLPLIKKVLAAGANPIAGSDYDPMGCLFWNLTKGIARSRSKAPHESVHEALKAILWFAESGGKLPVEYELSPLIKATVGKQWTNEIIAQLEAKMILLPEHWTTRPKRKRYKPALS
jgi:hypothetical protein